MEGRLRSRGCGRVSALHPAYFNCNASFEMYRYDDEIMSQASGTTLPFIGKRTTPMLTTRPAGPASVLPLKQRSATMKSGRNPASPPCSSHRQQSCCRAIRKSATMNSLSADHQPSSSNGSRTTPVDNDLSNPLWILAAGMACFFGTAVVVMALSWN